MVPELAVWSPLGTASSATLARSAALTMTTLMPL